MNLKRAPRNPHRPERQYGETRLGLLDTVMDSYLHWRDESRTVEEVYRQWQTAGARSAATRSTGMSRRSIVKNTAHDYRRVIEQTRA